MVPAAPRLFCGAAACGAGGSVIVRSVETVGRVTRVVLESALDGTRFVLELGADVAAHRSLPAALWCAAVSADVAEAVTTALGLGGDADTTASMAGAVGGAAGGPATRPAALRVATVQCPAGPDATHRAPRGARPRRRCMSVVAADSSTSESSVTRACSPPIARPSGT